MSRVDLDLLVRDLFELLRASAARHCTVHYEGTPAFIDGAATQLRQVVMNLVINAAEAVEEGSGEVCDNGHGLGLAAAQGIMRGHRGAMHVHGTVGGGSKFRCWLPLAGESGTGARPDGQDAAQTQPSPVGIRA